MPRHIIVTMLKAKDKILKAARESKTYLLPTKGTVRQMTDFLTEIMEAKKNKKTFKVLKEKKINLYLIKISFRNHGKLNIYSDK